MFAPVANCRLQRADPELAGFREVTSWSIRCNETARGDTMTFHFTRVLWAFALGLLLASSRASANGTDDHNPIGTTGAFEGVIMTGGAYNALSHNATRQIDDLIVPGAIGKYGLKMTRYYNSRNIYGSMSPGWSAAYSWEYDRVRGKVSYPNGQTWEASCADPLGVSDGWIPGPDTRFRLADGGIVVFETATSGRPIQIIDPYGQTTNITYAADGSWKDVTEPGGRYLHFIYDASTPRRLTRVEAHGLGNATVTDWVSYTYASQPTGGTVITSRMCLTRVDYSDSTAASYTYQLDNGPEILKRGFNRMTPLLKGADDVRYQGAMRRIAYEFRQSHAAHGDLWKERYWDGIVGHELSGIVVSTIDPPAPDPTVNTVNFETTYTETRGDAPSRSFTYTPMHLHRFDDDTCPTPTMPPYLNQQFLQSYTDFSGKTTSVAYDSNWYVNALTNANYQTTTYLRGPPPDAPYERGIGQVLRITRPDNTHVDYTYQPEGDIGGHYVASITNELGAVTVYTRDPVTHVATRIDYPADAQTPASWEEFTYNSFGQVLTHRLKNGAWVKFKYDSRGLLTDSYSPKMGAVPLDSDPHTHQTYYTSALWADRVQTVTLPANASGYVASETYEYDSRRLGLLTKVTHADGTFKSMDYDTYGNKLWEENELRQRVAYTYDDYNRVLSVTDPLSNVARSTYVPTNGGGGSSYKHTTAHADTVTTPTGIITSNIYDVNFRLSSTTAAFGTTLAATTTFAYDDIGNQIVVTDPLFHETHHTYDVRNRKIATTEVWGTPLQRTTSWVYEADRVTQIARPDGTVETKTYDALDRVLTDTVPKSDVVYLTTSFRYNPSGTMQQVTDANGNITSFEYDDADRKTKHIYSNGDTQRWAYDDAGNLKWRYTVHNEQQSYSFDNRNRKTGMTWSNSADWANYAYDGAGRLTVATNPNATVTRSYDAAGHLTQDQQNVTGLGIQKVDYPTYDADGRLTRMYVENATGYDFTYAYDAIGRLDTINLTPNIGIFQYHYNAVSAETGRDSLLSDGIHRVYTLDALNRLQALDVTKGFQTLSHESYTYDVMDRMTLVDRSDGHPDTFGYFLDGELRTANLGNLAHNLTYNVDNVGNRTSVVDNNNTTSYSPNNINQYASVSAHSIVNGPEHEISSYDGVSYGYINDEHLTSATTGAAPSLTGPMTSGGSVTYSMAYDALGRCVKRSLSNAPTTYYVYDGEKPVLEFDGGTGHPEVGVNVYGKGIDEILERVALDPTNAWQNYYPQQDHAGSVTLLTDNNGAAVERYRYDAFGAPTVYSGTWGARASTAYDNRFLFTGREYAGTYRSSYATPAFAFYEYRARAYHPGLGRFLSEDPKLFGAGDYNLFRYVGNNPVNATDPMGLEEQPTSTTNAPAYMDKIERTRTPLEKRDDNARDFDSGSLNNSPAGYATWFNNNWKTLSGANQAAAVRRLEGGSDGTSSTTPAFDPIGAATGALASRIAVSGAAAAMSQIMKSSEAALINLIKNVNPKGGWFNCVNCGIATRATLAGRPACAMPGGMTSFWGPRGVQASIGGSWMPSSRSAIEAHMLNLGPGSQRVILGYPSSGPGHIFNAINHNGAVSFLDGQIGGRASLQGYAQLGVFEP